METILVARIEQLNKAPAMLMQAAHDHDTEDSGRLGAVTELP